MIAKNAGQWSLFVEKNQFQPWMMGETEHQNRIESGAWQALPVNIKTSQGTQTEPYAVELKYR